MSMSKAKSEQASTWGWSSAEKVFSLPRAVDLYQHALCFGRWTRAWNVWTGWRKSSFNEIYDHKPGCDSNWRAEIVQFISETSWNKEQIKLLAKL
jgi:hypothetical protein